MSLKVVRIEEGKTFQPLFCLVLTVGFLVDSNFWCYYYLRWISYCLGTIQCSSNYVSGLAWVLWWSFTILLVCCNIFYLYSMSEGSGLVMVMVELQF